MSKDVAYIRRQLKPLKRKRVFPIRIFFIVFSLPSLITRRREGDKFFTFTAENDSSSVDPVEKNRMESDDVMYIQHSSPFARVVS